MSGYSQYEAGQAKKVATLEATVEGQKAVIAALERELSHAKQREQKLLEQMFLKLSKS